MARRKHLHADAAAQAAAAAAPQRHAVRRQIHAARRDRRSSTRSLRSMDAALQDSITTARREVHRQPGLTTEDRATALASLSAARVSATAGTNFATQQVRQETAGQIADLHQTEQDITAEQGTATAAALADLVAAAKDRAATKSEAVAGRHFDARQNALDRAATLKAAKGPTPAEAKAHRQDFKTAMAVAENAYQIAAAQGTEPSDEAGWQKFLEVVSSHKGVNDYKAAQDAVDKVRRRAIANILQAASVGSYTPPRNAQR